MKRVLLTMDRTPGGYGPHTMDALRHAADASGVDARIAC